jgi:hypothetical protein
MIVTVGGAQGYGGRLEYDGARGLMWRSGLDYGTEDRQSADIPDLLPEQGFFCGTALLLAARG